MKVTSRAKSSDGAQASIAAERRRATARIQYPLKSVSLVVSRIPRWLIRAWEAPIANTPATATIAEVPSDHRVVSRPTAGPTESRVKRSAPRLMAARTATIPKRFSHAVPHPQPFPPRIEAQ